MASGAAELAYASVDELSALLAARQASAEEVVRESLERIERIDPALNAVVAVRGDRALAEARAADRLPVEERGPLHGIPFAVKDVTETLDLPTTYGSVAFRDHVAGVEAGVVARLRAAGGILVAKTNTPELACEPVTRSELHGETRNPWALERTPGGSSGGAGAGVAAGLFPLAQGTDAGGSIRIPASCCGVVGIKPTRGLVTLSPGTPHAWGGLLHNGPLARTVRDAAAMLDAMAALAPADAAAGGGALRAACDAAPRRLRVACWSGAGAVRLDADVAAAFEDARAVVGSLGAELVEAAPDVAPLAEPFMVVASVAFAGMGAALDDELLALIGAKCLALMKRGWAYTGAAYYGALEEMHRRSEAVLAFWREHDALLTPTVPLVPPRRDRFPSTEEHDAKWAEFAHWEAFTSFANATGQPAVSLPAPRASREGLPIGVQLVGRPHAEAELLGLAAAYEAETGRAGGRPPPPEPVG